MIPWIDERLRDPLRRCSVFLNWLVTVLTMQPASRLQLFLAGHILTPLSWRVTAWRLKVMTRLERETTITLYGPQAISFELVGGQSAGRYAPLTQCPKCLASLCGEFGYSRCTGCHIVFEEAFMAHAWWGRKQTWSFKNPHR